MQLIERINRQLTGYYSRESRAMVSLVLVFAALSLLFSLSSWGRAVPPSIGTPLGIIHEIPDVIGHLLFGMLACLPSRQRPLIVTGGLLGVVLDADHLGRLIGFPLLSRASHSVGFLIVAAIAVGLFTRQGYLKLRVTSWTASAIAAAIVVGHIALDAFIGYGSVPMLAPFSFTEYTFSRIEGLELEVIAFLLVLAARQLNSKAMP